jgi:hypothetical protein
MIDRTPAKWLVVADICEAIGRFMGLLTTGDGDEKNTG